MDKSFEHDIEILDSVRKKIEQEGDNHFLSNIDTPNLDNAFDLSDEEKISNIFMIMQVHDELVFEIKEADIPTIGAKIINLMTNAEALKVPLIVNTFHGNSWRDV